MSIFDLLARFIENLFVWLPRPLLVSQFEGAVRWTLGRAPVQVFGLTWWMPLIHHVETVDMRVDATEFEPKVLWTKDGREVAIGMVVAWRVTDPVKCSTTVNGLNTLVGRLGESVLPELVGRFGLDDLKRKAAGGEGREWGFDQHLLFALNALFDEYGVQVVGARVNFTSDRVRTFKIIAGGGDSINSVAIQSGVL